MQGMNMTSGGSRESVEITIEVSPGEEPRLWLLFQNGDGREGG
jgi:hypothetical protein